MKFSTRKDTELSADRLFDAIVDFDRLDRILMRRGAAVARKDSPAGAGLGTRWQIGFDWRARRRDLRLAVVRFDRPERLVLQGGSEALDLTVDLTIVALSRARSRLIFEAEAKPRNLRARVMLQTARLGKSQLDQQFGRGVARLLDELTASAAGVRA